MHDDIETRATALQTDLELYVEGALDKRLGKPRLVGVPGTPPGYVPGFDDDPKTAAKFSLSRAAVVALSENPRMLGKEFGLEVEAMRATRDAMPEDSLVMRTLTDAAGATGGFLVPTVIADGIIRSVLAQTILGKLNARQVKANTGTLTFTKSTNITSYWVDTASEQVITASDPTFSQITLRPRALACLTALTYLMVQNTDPAADDLVRDLMAASIAQRIDQDFFLGSGAAAEPRGLINNATVSTRTVSFSGLKLGPTAVGANGLLQKLRAMVNKIRTDAASTQSLGWFGEPLTALAPEIAVDTTGAPIFVETGSSQVGTLLGRPFGVTPALINATTTAMRFGVGDFSQAVLASWGSVMFAVSNAATATSFSTATTHLRAIGLFDTAVLEPLSFCLATAYNAADVVNS